MTLPDSRLSDLLAARRAVLFDLDDTLITYGPSVNDVWPDVFALTGNTSITRDQLSKAYATVFKPMWGDPARQRAHRTNMRNVWSLIMTESFRTFGLTVEPDLHARMVEEFARRIVASTQLLPDAADTLRQLRCRGLKLGLLTNGDPRIQRAKLAHLNLADAFDVIVVEGEFGAGKPDPAVYRHALAALDVAPHEAVMVGDNLEFDVLAPISLGIAGVWLSRHNRPLPDSCPTPHPAVITSVAQLLHPAAASSTSSCR